LAESLKFGVEGKDMAIGTEGIFNEKEELELTETLESLVLETSLN